jgi:hypothetical protein
VKKLVLVIALLMVIPVVLVGCGAKSDKAAIEDSINGFFKALNDGNYDKCTDYLVGVNDANSDNMTAELKAMKETLNISIEVVKIEDVKVTDSSATAKVTLKVSMGEIEAEQPITLPLTKVDGKWKFSPEDLQSLAG